MTRLIERLHMFSADWTLAFVNSLFYRVYHLLKFLEDWAHSLWWWMVLLRTEILIAVWISRVWVRILRISWLLPFAGVHIRAALLNITSAQVFLELIHILGQLRVRLLDFLFHNVFHWQWRSWGRLQHRWLFGHNLGVELFLRWCCNLSLFHRKRNHWSSNLQSLRCIFDQSHWILS